MFLYCASEDFNLSIWRNLACNMNRKKKKQIIFQKSSSHYVYQHIFPILAQRPCWCLRATRAVQGLLQPHHQEMPELCPQAGKQTEKEQEVLPKPLKDFLQHRQHFLNFSSNGLQERLHDLQPILWNVSHFNASQLKWKLCFVIPN